MKKTVLFLLVLCFTTQLFGGIAHASPEEVAEGYASYYAIDQSGEVKGKRLNIASASTGDTSCREYTTIDSKPVIKLISDGVFRSGTEYISLKIRDDFYETLGNDSLNISVSYYDTGTGKFILRGSDKNGARWLSDVVYMTGSNTWKVYTYTMHGGMGQTLNISAYDHFMGQSAEPIYFDKINITKTGNTFPVYIKDISPVRGNMFYDNSEASSTLQLNNRLSETIILNCDYILTDAYGKTYTGSKNNIVLTPGNNSVKINYGILPYSTYTADLDFYDDKGIFGSYRTNFSRSVTSEPNDNWGINSHYNTYPHRDEVEALNQIKKMGGSMIRECISWSVFESNNRTIHQSAWDVIEAAEANDVDVLITLTGPYSPYCSIIDVPDSSIDINLPVTEDQIEAFGQYVYDVVEALEGRVEVFQIWNEVQGNCGNDPDLMRQYYVPILKKGYERAKEANPNCIVLGGSGFECVGGWWTKTWIDALIEDAYDYMDGLNLHVYVPIYDMQAGKWYPEQRTIPATQQGVSDVNAKCDEMGKPRLPVWITENGWPTAYVTDIEQAEYATRNYIASKAAGVEKLIYYDMENDGTCRTEEQSTYGVTYSVSDPKAAPMSAKPAYVAFSNMNKQLSGTTFDAWSQTSNGADVYRFIKENGDNVYCYYDSSESLGTTSMKLPWNSIIYTDMFGNETIMDSEDGNYTFAVSGAPIYITEYKNNLPSNENIAVREINYQTGNITVWVRGFNEQATILVTKPGYDREDIITEGTDALAYISQPINCSDYTFTFRADADGEYVIYANVNGSVVRLGAEVYRSMGAVVELTQNGVPITDFSQIGAGKPIVASMKIDNIGGEADNYMLVLSAYKSGAMKMLKSICGSFVEGDAQVTDSVEITVEDITSIDNIKVFLWRGETRLIPIIKNLNI